MPEATPSDVAVEIDTHLDDTKIQTIIDRVGREVGRAYDDSTVVFDDTQHQSDFEATLTALRIAEGWDRRAEEVSTGGTSESYETSEIENLRKRVRRLDPGEEFGYSSDIIRDTDRHTTTGGDQ